MSSNSFHDLPGFGKDAGRFDRTPRNELIRIAEQFRNNILAHLSIQALPRTVREICEAPELKESMGGTLDFSYVDRAVRQLHKEGKLLRTRTTLPGDNSRYAYELSVETLKLYNKALENLGVQPIERKPFEIMGDRKDPVVKEPVHKTIQRPSSQAVLPPDVQLDILQSTGRLRITFRGLVVELGIIQ